MDPHLHNLTPNNQIAQHIFDNLINQDEAQRLVPALATEWAFPGLDAAPDAPVTQLARRLAERNDHGKVAYGTEGGLFAEIGIPTVVIRPGAIAQAHRADEFIEKAELDSCERFIDRLIEHCRHG